MERFRRMRRIVALLIAIFLVNTALMAVMIPAWNMMMVTVMIVQLIVILYFAVLSRGLIKEAEEMERKDEERKEREREAWRAEKESKGSAGE